MGMRYALAAFARAGNDVLVDDVFIDPAWLVGWRNELIDVKSLLVSILGAGAFLERRERARGNRIAGEARASV